MDDKPQRIIGPERQTEDVPTALDDRPQTLEEYDVGQRELIDGLRITIAAAKQRSEPLEHILLTGPGQKTTRSSSPRWASGSPDIDLLWSGLPTQHPHQPRPCAVHR
jgi:hypothetical protein